MVKSAFAAGRISFVSAAGPIRLVSRCPYLPQTTGLKNLPPATQPDPKLAILPNPQAPRPGQKKLVANVRLRALCGRTDFPYPPLWGTNETGGAILRKVCGSWMEYRARSG